MFQNVRILAIIIFSFLSEKNAVLCCNLYGGAVAITTTGCFVPTISSSCQRKIDASATRKRNHPISSLIVTERRRNCYISTISKLDNSNKDDNGVTFKTQPLKDEQQQSRTLRSNKQNSKLRLSPTTTHKSRREALRQIATTTSLLGIGLTTSTLPASAGLPEIDTKSGELFSPKQQMMGGGGSTAARGVNLQPKTRQEKKRGMFDKSESIQTVYETRFIVYLSRFILQFDPAASAWWKEGLKKVKDADASSKKTTTTQIDGNPAIQLLFAEFAESVEIGLADYFVGPYGSYASVQAAKAGINAAAPATSSLSASRTTTTNKADTSSLRFSDIFGGWAEQPLFGKHGGGSNGTKNDGKRRKSIGSKQREVLKIEKQGVLNLYALLKARYTSREAKIHLALLFSMISNPALQPIAEIKGLLGEIDNATLKQIDIVRPSSLQQPSLSLSSQDEITAAPAPINKKVEFRSSSRKGGGYSITNPPNVIIEPPPALGDDYKPAKGEAIMRPTTRILRINVTDGGEGYTSAPSVTVVQSNGIVRRQCDACAIMDRNGRVESIIVLDPGLGYGGSGSSKRGGVGEVVAPTVKISAPKRRQRKDSSNTKTSRDENTPKNKKIIQQKMRPAKAVAELEYEVVGIDIISEGSGYVLTQPPNVYVTPSNDDPDWFVPPVKWDVRRDNNGREDDSDGKFFKVKVTSMQNGYDSSVVDTSAFSTMSGNQGDSIGLDMVQHLYDDPIGLLPSDIRPVFAIGENNEMGCYKIPSLPPAPANVPLPSPRYQAIDPLFGGIGKAPVTKGAMSLSISEYSRLALSGAVCTVIVRTLLNPLELIKTKIQLGNDKELNEFAMEKAAASLRKKNEEDTQGKYHRATSDIEKSLTKNKLSDDVSLSNEEKNLALVSAQSTAEGLQPDTRRAMSRKTARKKVGVDVETGRPTKMNAEEKSNETQSIGTLAMISSLIELRGPLSLFQSADITFLASLVFGSFGFGATELFRRSFSVVFFEDNGGGSNFGSELVLLAAAALATVITSAAATPFETIRVRSMGIIESKSWKVVLGEFLDDKRKARNAIKTRTKVDEELEELLPSKERFRLRDIKRDDFGPLMAGFSPIVSRELPFAITKFLVFDLVATAAVELINAQPDMIEQVQVGVGSTGLAVSAGAGALAGIAGAFVSHPADLILTLTSASVSQKTPENGDKSPSAANSEEDSSPDWRLILKEILEKEGGPLNLFAGFPARATFFFLVIGLQFFLYDFVKGLFRVGSEDLQLVLDVFYAIRQGLLSMDV